MTKIDSFNLDISQCFAELKEFEDLLLTKDELSESKDILPFFRSRLNLSAFIAYYAPSMITFDRIKHEFSFFGDFRADLVVGDATHHTYCFIEFEDAAKNSIFTTKRGKSTSEWSPRFEHGFSQIIDWFWKIDDLKNTDSARNIFGDSNIEIYGIIVIGRDKFLSEPDRRRLKWRLNKVVVDSRKVICITFDQLAKDIRDRLSLYQTIYEAEPESE
jgi:hypothetical protein